MAKRVGRTEAGGAARGFTIFLVVIIIIALVGVVLYLLSDINSRRYRLAAHHGKLTVQKGRNLPVGFATFVPKAEALKTAYEPLEMPKGIHFDRSDDFGDRADLDRALFMVLASWARQGLKVEDPAALKRATEYISRCQMLPGLSEQQRIELNTLRADLAYRRGTQMIRQTAGLLYEALAEFRLAKQLGTSRPTNSDHWIGYLQQRIQLFGGQLPAEWPHQSPPGAYPPQQSPQQVQPLQPPGSQLQPPRAQPSPSVVQPRLAPGAQSPPATAPPAQAPSRVEEPQSPESPEEKAQPGKWRL